MVFIAEFMRAGHEYANALSFNMTERCVGYPEDNVPHFVRVTILQRLQRPVTDPNLELGGEGIGKWGDTVNAWNRV